MEFWISDKTVDLKPAVIADIMLNMPMKAECSDHCEGLCPKCGIISTKAIVAVTEVI